MITFSEAEQRSEQWFAERCGLLTASRFATATSKGASRRSLLMELAAEQLTGQPTPSFTNQWMQRGIDLEPHAVSAFEFVTDRTVQPVGLVTNSDYPGLGASPDGLIGANGLLEVKCPKPSTQVEYALAGKLPARYKAQVYGQMLITGRTEATFVSYCPEIRSCAALLIVEVPEDPIYMDSLAVGLRAFVDELEEIVEELSD